ncbi:MAG: hypothetical protein ACKPCI_16810 [Dolichospermum sp.]
MGITDRVWYRLQSSGVLRPVHKGVAVLVGVMIAKNTP